MKLKILSTGSFLKNSNIDCYNFYNAPTFTDYDAVIIDPSEIDIWSKSEHVIHSNDGSLWSYTSIDGGFVNEITKKMKQRSSEIGALLEITGGIVVCFLRNIGKILYYRNYQMYYSDDHTHNITIYDWIPPKGFNNGKPCNDSDTSLFRKEYVFSSRSLIDTQDRVGKGINKIIMKNPFSKYFIGLKNEIYFEKVVNESKILKILHPIAHDKVDAPISFEINYGKGKIIFLPPIDFCSNSDKICGILAECIRNSFQWSPPYQKPSWLKKYNLPDENNIKKAIADFELEINTLKDQKDLVQKKADDMEQLKEMLYESGKQLENSVRKAFRIIGFGVIEPEKYHEPYDLFAKENELHIVGEIEGSTGQVDIQKYRQLLDYVTDVSVVKNKKCKGIIIGNGFLDIEPEKRQEQFTTHAIKGCNDQGYCRITTTELFKIIQSIMSEQDNEEKKKLIKERILNCRDEFKL